MEQKLNLIKQGDSFQFTVIQQYQGQRIDKFLSSNFSEYSRSFLQKLFDQKNVLINKSKIVKPSYALKIGDLVSIDFPEQSPSIKKEIPQDIGVSIIAKEQDFLIINKPAGLVVHPPNSTCQEVTLSDWLTSTYQDIAHVGTIDRPGIVHRLDKDTSGLMIIPRTSAAHATMTDMFKNRKIQKSYLALVKGHPSQTGTIDLYVGRHPHTRNKMLHFTELTKQASSRTALTNYEVIQYYKDFSLVKVKPITGRTHQIRVHFAAIGHPVLADQLYGKKLKSLKRQALHAHQLEFEYRGKQYAFTSPLDIKLQQLLQASEPIQTELT